MIPPNIEKNLYNHHKLGTYGEYGAGQGTKVFYMQVGFAPQEIEKISMIGDIRGSEKWSVPDLFQREVDEQRVRNEILPYLENEHLIKYFSPLTLTFLPIIDDGDGTSVIQKVPALKSSIETEDGHEWTVYEAKDLYKFRHIVDRPEYAEVSWNDSKIRAVAIDGQHRLSALKKRYASATHDEQWIDFSKWTIPTVIFGLKTLRAEGTPTILDVVRTIFIYINKEAKPPTRNRNILLNDNSVNCILAQEILEYSHQNDVQGSSERDKEIMPLLFFGWREEQIHGENQSTIAQLKTVEEIHDLIFNFLLGEDSSPGQLANLGIQADDELYSPIDDGNITSADLKLIRAYLKKDVLKGVTYFLNNFSPYKTYSKYLRDLEEAKLRASSWAVHAFHKLRFGTDQGLPADEKVIEAEFKSIKRDITDHKNNIPDEIKKLITLRGIMYAFGFLRIRYSDEVSDNWLEFSKWFTNIINSVYDNGWFANDIAKSKKDLLRHVTYDHSDMTCNFKFERIPNGLGSFLVLLCAAHSKKNSKFPTNESWEAIKKDCLANLDKTIEGGYRRQFKIELQNDPEVMVTQLKSLTNKKASKETDKQISKIDKQLEDIISPDCE